MLITEVQNAVRKMLEASNVSAGLTPPGNQTAVSNIGHQMIVNAQVSGLAPKRLFRKDGSEFAAQDPLTRERNPIPGYDFPLR